MSNRTPITVRLESFEGPLDLLLYLIQSHEFDISTVSIGKITDQYLAYIRLMRDLNFDMASEFLVMAATLLHWKSKSLLPEEKTEGDTLDAELGELSQEDLVRQLMEHQRFRAAGAQLNQLPLLGDDVFTRPNKRAPIERIWREMNISQLALGYQDMLVRARKRTQVLRKETVSLTDKILDFRDRLEVGKMVELKNLILNLGSRPETVVTFLASLELARLRKMKVHQEETYGPILLELIESLANFTTDLASGFDAPITDTVDAQARLAAASPVPPPMPMPITENLTV